MDNPMVFSSKLVFDHRSQEWSIFCSRFFQYCTASNLNCETDISGLKRKALLLTSLMEDTYRIAKALVFPEELDCVEFETLYEKLSAHFLPKRNTFAERFNFYKSEQRPGEELAEWAARVRSLAQYCAFSPGLELDTALRDRFVLGLENIKEKEKLFNESIETLTFNNALKIAQITHSARLALETIMQPVFPAIGNPVVRNICESCGQNHAQHLCRYKTNRCPTCKQVGHVKKMCNFYSTVKLPRIQNRRGNNPLSKTDIPNNNINVPHSNNKNPDC